MAFGNNIKYISYFFDFLEDYNFKSLISLLYNKNEFYNPYNTYKECFLALLLDCEAEKRSFNRGYIIPDELNSDMEYYEYSKEYDLQYNTYYILLEAFKNKEYMLYEKQKFFIGNNRIKNYNIDNDIESMVDTFNSIFIFPEKLDLDSENSIIAAIIQSLYSFKVEITPKNKYLFKKFINIAIKTMIENKHCYILYPIDNSSNNKSYEQWHLKVVSFDNNNNEENYEILQKNNKLYLTETIYEENQDDEDDNDLYIVNDADFSLYVNKEEIKHYTTMNNENDNHSLLGAKTPESYNNSLKSIDQALYKLKQKIAEKENCHVCNPILKNTTKKKQHMCDNCKKLIQLLLDENIDNLNQQKIVYAIKKKGQDFKNHLNLNEIRTLRHNNLVNFLIKLNNNNKIKNKKDIVTTVNKIFREFEKFYFYK